MRLFAQDRGQVLIHLLPPIGSAGKERAVLAFEAQQAVHLALFGAENVESASNGSYNRSSSTITPAIPSGRDRRRAIPANTCSRVAKSPYAPSQSSAAITGAMRANRPGNSGSASNTL
ncbi:hypothetical protein WR25_06417 [Diploscapter pachys]|uniref:Uncharacterized protein n=1 Tax=Diploscapter pachys TaxID=2018661 RepID=A0A2A2KAU3_9BILA|nr:hypothetical protein WR25_06417 [Diploscapter pachys]